MISSVRRTIILSRALVILTIGVQCTVLVEYKKPVPSNGPCIDKIEVMSATLQGGHENCFGCSVAKDECGVGCQVLINSIYAACEGVTLPLYYYFDPPENSVAHSFNDLQVQSQLRLSAAKCGCNSSFKRMNMFMSVVMAGIAVFVLSP